jgi:hypothetical protein
MKSLTTVLFFLLAAWSVQAQSCRDAVDFFKEGALLEYTNYDGKGKGQSVVQQTVRSLKENRDTLTALVDVKSFDNKGKETFNNYFPIKCHLGNIYMDMRSMVPNQMGAGTNAAAQVEITGSDLIFPSDMQPGQTLPDSDMKVKMTMNGMQLMSTDVRMYNRKVAAKESLTTPAGTFDCIKMTYNIEVKLMGTRTSYCEFWYAKKVGTVKSVTFDKKGDVESRMELTKFKS